MDKDSLGPAGTSGGLEVQAAPLLREALREAQPGEDFDEALLRTLKARHPERAAALLAAFSSMLDLEAERAHENKEQAVRRLAETDPSPTIRLSPPQVRVTRREYRSLEEMPPELRRQAEARLQAARPSRAGCLWSLLPGALAALCRWPGR